MSARSAVFDAKSKTFAVLSQDNRLHLWDVETRKEKKAYVDKNHLSHSFTCFAWKQGKKDKLGEFVVGYSDGIIIVWDLVRGVVSRTIGTANSSSAPTDIVFSTDKSSILVATNETHVTQYSVATGEEVSSIKAGKKGVTKLAAHPSLNVVAAAGSSSIKVIDLDGGDKKKLSASFAGGVSAMAFSSCGEFLVVASARGREVLVFDVRPESDVETPVHVVPVNGIVVGLDARKHTKLNATEVLVHFADSNGCVFRVSNNYAQNMENKVESLLSTTHIKSNGKILAGYLDAASAEGRVFLAVGQQSHPKFQQVSVESASGEALEKVEVGEAASSSAEATNGYKQPAGGDLKAPDVLGPHEMGGVKRPVVEDEAAAAAAAAGGSNKKSKKAVDVVTSVSNELTLEQRLESLSRSLNELEDAADAELPSTLANSLAATQAPTADSLVTLVDQALQSGDDYLLEQCLVCTDNDVVEATAKRLPTGRLVVFLRKLVAKFEKRPSRGVLLTRWLAAVLRHHTSFLVTVPDLSFQLAGLSQMLEQRLASYSRLSSLAGRLDLLLSQVSYNQANGVGAASNKDKLAAIVPRQVYQEN